VTELVEPAYALLTDGTGIEIRRLRPEDAEAVRRMHQQMSPDNLWKIPICGPCSTSPTA
jgi:hypothetical protein